MKIKTFLLILSVAALGMIGSIAFPQGTINGSRHVLGNLTVDGSCSGCAAGGGVNTSVIGYVPYYSGTTAISGANITGAVKAGNPPTRAACADLSNAASSCSTDATNASNLSSGQIPGARSYFYPIIVPVTASSWTAVGSTSTLTDVTGGGLSWKSAVASTPGGYYVATVGGTYTFRANIKGSASSANTGTSGALGIFCEDSGGNAILLHADFITAAASTNMSRLTISEWTSMTASPSTPAFSASITPSPQIQPDRVPEWLGIRDDGTTRYYEYSVDGTTWVTYLSHPRATFSTCTRVGFEGYGDGTYASLAAILSVRNN